MKKLILLFMLVLGSIACFAQEESVKETTKVSDEVLTVVDGICDKLQVPAEKVWSVLTQTQTTKGILNFTLAIPFLIILLFIIRTTIKFWDSQDIEDIHIFSVIIGGLLSILIISLCLYQGIMQIAAPEYMALQEILELVK